MPKMQRIESIESLRRFFGLYSLFKAKYSYTLEQQKENELLWLPIIFSLGIGLYFLLPFEPPLILGAVIWLMIFAVHQLTRTVAPQPMARLLYITLIIATGFTASIIRTQSVHTPVLEKKVKFALVQGTIKSIEKLDQGQSSRIILTNNIIDKVDEIYTPRKIRLKIRADSNIRVGQTIEILADLNPPSPPFMPGGFDFRRYLYFQGIGAVGFVYKEPIIINDAPQNIINIEHLRQTIAQRIETVLPPRNAPVATALIIGQKNALSDEDKQAIRDAGLAHMLAISGLHIGLVAGTIFFLFRFAFACVPRFALQYPIKKIAVVFAFLGAVFYMLLAGATIPTQRAVLMIGIVFLAVILDRSPISLRLVAFSAFTVLLFSPESLLSASFNMSFAAVTCLIYFYDVTRNFWTRMYTNANWFHRLLMYFLSVCLTTLIASIATAPFALYHFGQVSFSGSLSNLIAVPILAFIIMPFALIATIALPLGLEYWPLKVVGYGINIILDLSHWAADLPNAVLVMPSWSFMSFSFMIMASLFFIVWRGWSKIIALPILALSIFININSKKPDIIIAGSHKLFTFAQDNELYVSTKRRERFTLENIQKYYGIEDENVSALPYKGMAEIHDFYSCGENGCRFEIDTQNIAYIKHPIALKEDCHWADIIISEAPVKDWACKAPIIIDKFDTWKKGAHAIWVNENETAIRTVSERSSNRPWSAFHSKDRD